MKNFLAIIFIVALGFILGGCPYETIVPIEPPSVKIETRLIGSWTDAKNKYERYKVNKWDEFTYDIMTSSKEDKMEHFLAYPSIVNKVTFLNLWEKKMNDSAHTFALYKLAFLNENTVTITEVSDSISQKFSSGEALKKFIFSNMNNRNFYGKDEIKIVRR